MIRLCSTTKGTNAPTVEGVPMLGGEPGTSQHEFKGLDMQEVFHDDGSIEDTHDDVPVVPVAKLSMWPQSLYDLWKEYEFGVHGCKSMLLRGEQIDINITRVMFSGRA